MKNALIGTTYEVYKHDALNLDVKEIVDENRPLYS